MNKKIGILTSTQSFSDNYGAVLQAYALSCCVKELGFEPNIIRYKVEGEHLNHSAPISERLKSTLFNPNMSFHAKKRLVINKLKRRSVASVFGAFTRKHLNFFNEDYVTNDDLKKDTPPLDAFITGSDQVWNPVIHGNKNDPGYFLDFVPENKKRIAYAPSMGVDKIPEECENTLKDFLDKFDALSIREQSGAQIIKKCCNIDVPVVLDPTLLLSDREWDKISQNPDNLPEKYIFCYKFGKSKTMDKTIKSISKKYNLPIVTAPSTPEVRFKADYNIGPAEFLGAIKNATLVCADSFHATVFSIIYKKPFLIFPRHASTSKVNMNSRMENLLETFDLKDRYIPENTEYDKETLFEISFINVDNILEEKQKESKKYLENALENI